MQLETQRLIIRPWQPAQDARDAMDIYSDLRVMAWLEGECHARSILQVQGRLQQCLNQEKRDRTGYWSGHGSDHGSSYGSSSWAVEQTDIGRVIGQVGLRSLPDIQGSGVELAANVANLELEGADDEGLSSDYVEISWHFRPASWGYGYATEAAFGLAHYAFEVLRLPLLIAICDPENKRAIALMNQLGMTDDGFTTRYFGGKALRLYRLEATDQGAVGVDCAARF